MVDADSERHAADFAPDAQLHTAAEHAADAFLHPAPHALHAPLHAAATHVLAAIAHGRAPLESVPLLERLRHEHPSLGDRRLVVADEPHDGKSLHGQSIHRYPPHHGQPFDADRIDRDPLHPAAHALPLHAGAAALPLLGHERPHDSQWQ